MCSKQAIQDYMGSLEYQLHQEAREKVDEQVWADKLVPKGQEVILDYKGDLGFPVIPDQKVRTGDADHL